MNSKAFTLVELIGIILILGAIFFVSFPTFLNLAKEDNEKEFKDMVKDLCLAGETYIYSNIDEFRELSNVGSTINIEVKELVSYGNVNSDLKNPNTKESVTDDSLLYIVLSDKSLDCKYVDN